MAKVAVREEILRHARHRSQIGLIVVCFSRSMNGSGSTPASSPRVRRNFVVAKQPDRRLQIRAVECLAQLAAEFTIHADVYVRFGQTCHVIDMSADREGEIDFACRCPRPAAGSRRGRTAC